MKKRISCLFAVLLCSISFFAQENKCGLTKSISGIYSIEGKDVSCIAENSDKSHTIFYTFAWWCAPCKINIVDTMNLLSENENADLYVVLIDKEGSEFLDLAIQYVEQNFPKFPAEKILVIKDYEKRGKTKKYKEFLTAVTPKPFEVIDDMSKFIILNKQGETLLVTSWKDRNGGKSIKDWKFGDAAFIKRAIFPVLTN
jgi:thiol-disulfide isomerase/thioredoxin